MPPGFGFKKRRVIKIPNDPNATKKRIVLIKIQIVLFWLPIKRSVSGVQAADGKRIKR